MTAAEIAERFATQAISQARVQKLVQLCRRMRVEIEDVLVELPPEDQSQVRAFL